MVASAEPLAARAASPFVGPEPYSRADGGLGRHLYGRETEVEALFNLLVTERVALLYSPSGAGKSSLIEARLVPRLEAEGMVALPTARVGLQVEVEHGSERLLGNRYLRSALSTLGADLGNPPASLEDFLDARRNGSDDPQLLILDQFEEVLIQDPTDQAAKEVFFQELGAALRDPGRWALLSIREDYVAGLDPFLRFLPIRPGARFRLDLLGPRAARQAIVQPARDHGVDFSPVADHLVRELSMMRVQLPGGQVERQPGPVIEPVQLQLVCVRLWNNRPADATRVSEEDVEGIGDVDQALAHYYSDTVAAIAATTHVEERRIREWVDQHLLTHQHVRGQVLQDVDESEGLPNRAILALVDAHLVRAERRRGFTWFELAHDRLIEPVLDNNRSWFRDRLSPLQQRAAIWDQQERSPALLLDARQLADAEPWAAEHRADLLPREREFLDASRKARQVAARERRLFRGLVAVMALAIVSLIAAVIQLQYTLNSRSAEEALRAANAVRDTNAANDLAAAARSQFGSDPALSGILAVQAARRSPTQQANDALRAVAPALHQLATIAHEAPVTAVAVSPDGRTVASGSLDGDLRLSDCVTGELHRRLPTDGRALRTVAFSPEGSLVVVAGDGGVVRLFDTGSGEVRATMVAHTASVVAVAFSPDGSELASASRDHTARLWNAHTGAPIGTPLAHTPACTTCDASVVDVAFDHGGTRVVTASYDNTARVWDARSGAELAALRGHTQAVVSAAWSPDDSRVVTGSYDQTVRLWDPRTGRQLAEAAGMPNPTLRVSFSPDGTLVGAVSGKLEQPRQASGEQARTWDAQALTLIQQMQGHADAIIAGLFDPDGVRFLTASWDGTARIWSSRAGSLLERLAGSSRRLLDAALSPDGRLLVTGSDDMTARVWTTTPEVTDAHWANDVPVVRAAFNSTDTLLALTGSDGGVRLWNVESRTTMDLPNQIRSDRSTTSATPSPDHRHLLTTTSDGRALVWDLWGGSAPVVFDAQSGPVLASAISDDGAYVATSHADSTVRVWGATTGAQLAAFHATASSAVVLAFTPAGDELVSVWGDGSAQHWNWRSDRSDVVLRDMPLPMTSVAMGGRATRVVAGDPAGHLRVWDLTTGRQIADLEGPKAPVAAVDLSADGTFVVDATGSFDPPVGGNAVWVWDVDAARWVAILPGDPAVFTSAVFSRDGEFVAVSLDDAERSERVYRWRLSQPTPLLADWVQQLVDRTGRVLSPGERSKFGLSEDRPQ